MNRLKNKQDEVFNVNHFYKNFDIEHTIQQINEKRIVKGSHKQKVSNKLYKAVLKQYFDIYFKELYFGSRTKYFLFGGCLSICHTNSGIRYSTVRGITGYFKKEQSINFIWWLRPSALFFCVKMTKLTGSTNCLAKIEKMFRNNYNVELLPKFDDVKDNILRNKTAVRL